MKSVLLWAGYVFLFLWTAFAIGLVAALRLQQHARMPPRLWVRLILWSIPSWVFVILFVRGPLYLLGFPLVKLQAGNVERRVSPSYAGVSAGRVLLQFRAWYMWPFCNFEDAADGLRGGAMEQKWWEEETRGLRPEQRIYRWYCRNPINNLRYVPILCPRFDPPRIRYVGTGNEPPDGQTGWAYTSQGLYSGLYVKSTKRWIWIGWKFKTSDQHGMPPTDTRLPRADFATQWQRV